MITPYTKRYVDRVRSPFRSGLSEARRIKAEMSTPYTTLQAVASTLRVRRQSAEHAELRVLERVRQRMHDEAYDRPHSKRALTLELLRDISKEIARLRVTRLLCAGTPESIELAECQEVLEGLRMRLERLL